MFKVYWAPGKVNLADYFSKHHSASHVKKVRKLYVNETDSPRNISACNRILAQGVTYKGVLRPWVKPDISTCKPLIKTVDAQSV